MILSTCRRNVFCTQDESDNEMEETQLGEWCKEEWLQQASSITCMCESIQCRILMRSSAFVSRPWAAQPFTRSCFEHADVV